MKKNAIILAAGEGKRLLPYTKNKPKPLVKVNKISILENALNNLNSIEIDTVKIVIGHLGQVIKNKITNKYKSLKIEFIENVDYKNNNSMYSLYLALINEQKSILVIEGDIFFETSVLKNINECFIWFVDSSINNIDGAYLKKDKKNYVKKIEIIRNINLISNKHAKSVGIIYIPQKKIKKTIEILKKAIKNNKENLYYDLIFADNLEKLDIKLLDIKGMKWYEIDNIKDLENAKKLFQ